MPTPRWSFLSSGECNPQTAVQHGAISISLSLSLSTGWAWLGARGPVLRMYLHACEHAYAGGNGQVLTGDGDDDDDEHGDDQIVSIQLPQRTYILRADTPEELAGWVEMLKQGAVKIAVDETVILLHPPLP